MNYAQKVYVGLDTVLDLRLGALVAVYPDFAVAVTTSENYFLREDDVFGSDTLDQRTQRPFGVMPLDMLKKVTDHLGKKVVQAAMKTKINKFVRQLCATHWQAVLKQGQEIHPSIEINLWPYQFSKEELVSLQQVLSGYFGAPFAVSLIDLPPKRLTIDEVSKTYFAMVMYHYAEWVNAHDVALRKTPLRSTGLYVPRLYFEGKPPKEKLQDLIDNHADPFEEIGRALSPFLPVQYLPVAFFCADLPYNLESYTDPA